MDGEWQIGKKTMDEYGRLSQETAKAMKLIDPSIELVSCGSSFRGYAHLPTVGGNDPGIQLRLRRLYFPASVLWKCEQGTAGITLPCQTTWMSFIRTVTAACDFVKAKKRSKKTINSELR